MDPFSYLVVLTSIVLGLAVTRVIGGLGNIIQTRRRKHVYWVHIVWMMNLLLTITIVWWVAYRWRTQQHWTFFLFLWLLLTPTLLYLISALIFPDTDEAQMVTDWENYYYESHRDIFMLYALVFPIDLVDTL
jgi:cell division protein FtsW (lipid II flippase)